MPLTSGLTDPWGGSSCPASPQNGGCREQIASTQCSVLPPSATCPFTWQLVKVSRDPRSENTASGGHLQPGTYPSGAPPLAPAAMQSRPVGQRRSAVLVLFLMTHQVPRRVGAAEERVLMNSPGQATGAGSLPRTSMHVPCHHSVAGCSSAPSVSHARHRG